MDPERLAVTRAIICEDGGRPDVVFLCELLADRDHHAQRADAAERRLIARQDGELTAGPPSEAALRLLHANRELSQIRAVIADFDDGAAPDDFVARLRSILTALRSEALRLRARVRVGAEDVERAGVTRLHVEAWLRAKGWASEDFGLDVRWRCAAAIVALRGDHPGELADVIRALAFHGKRPGLDILDEMAAMPTEAT